MTKKETGSLNKSSMLIGWNEWCSLPGLRIPAIKAKIDTGAKTSALHAANIKLKCRKNTEIVYFDVYPLQRREDTVVHCRAAVIDKRYVMSSNGHKEFRIVILTNLNLGKRQWPIEVTLSNRDPLLFRMLLGREALKSNIHINPSKNLKQGRLSKSELASLYSEQ